MLSTISYALLALVAFNVLAVVVIARLGRRLSGVTDERSAAKNDRLLGSPAES